MSADRSNLSLNCKTWPPFKGPLRTLYRSFATWAVADRCLMWGLCIMGFVWRDSNGCEGSVMQLLDILLE